MYSSLPIICSIFAFGSIICLNAAYPARKDNDIAVLAVSRVNNLQTSTAHITNFPSVVSVRRKICSACAFEHYCGGTIYKENIIITAANCVRNADVAHVQIVVGTTFQTGAAQDGTIYPVKQLIFHENEKVDIALIQLSLNININGVTTKAVELATEMPAVTVKAIVPGWGQLSELDFYAEQLKKVTVPIMDSENCQKLYSWLKITNYEFCAGYATGGTDVCQGDAGSPLFVNKQMVGMVSWGYGCARANSPGVYTNIVQLKNWIETRA